MEKSENDKNSFHRHFINKKKPVEIVDSTIIKWNRKI